MIRNFTTKLNHLNNFKAQSHLQHKFAKLLSTNASSYFEEIEYPQYPPEDGIIQTSLYGDNIKIPKCTIDEYVWSNVNSWSNKTAIVCGVTGRNYSFAKLRDHSAALAVRLLKKLRLSPGETVAVCLPNIPEFPISALGIIEAGLIVTSVNPIYTAEEIKKQLIDSKAKAIIGIPMIYQTLKEAVKLTKRNIKIVCIKTQSEEAIPEGAIDFNEMIDTRGIHFDSLFRNEKDYTSVTFLPYSSGTTGMPKGVQLTHTNIISNCEMLKTNTGVAPIVLPTSESFQDVLPCVLPFFHIYGFTATLMSKLELGCQIVTLPSFRPDTFLAAQAKYKGTVLHLVPPIILFLTHHHSVTAKHIECIRNVFTGAAPLGAPDAERFLVKAPHANFAQGYGLTETSPVVLMGKLGSKNFASIGSPTPMTQAKIVELNDPNRTGLGPNLTGELYVRGPQVMKGYLNRDEETDEMLLSNGWLRTGDLAHYDENCQFYITDRLKELIKVKGFQVPPAELEEILRTHPDITDAAVIGQPHPHHGEIPRAFVVLKQNKNTTEKCIQSFVAEKVASYKRLEGGVTFLSAIPKNASGKIMRRQLKQEYCPS